MLFSSLEFVFVFLPLTGAGFFLLRHCGRARGVPVWLAVASLFFYGWWNPVYLWLLGASMAGNHGVARWMAARRKAGLGVRGWMWLGVGGNLLLLGYYKYAGMFARTLEGVGLWTGAIPEILLPLGISFFTFTQIAYLVDVARGEVEAGDTVSYVLFVTFFPHLLAGPILHHKEMMPQFGRELRPLWRAGVALFILGLSKKLLLADPLAAYVSPVFDAAAGTPAPCFLAAWRACLAFLLQVYFDFSGYSDMALALGWLFGIHLPANFNSPLKAPDIAELWKRWHMTLTRFLNGYLYKPLARGRSGPYWLMVNVTIVMFLGGLWHGASWSFVLWGLFQGLLLSLYAAWRFWSPWRLPRAAAVGLTFVSFVVGCLFFRANHLERVWAVGRGMLDVGHFLSVPDALYGWLSPRLPVACRDFLVLDTTVTDRGFFKSLAMLAFAVLVVQAFPNTLQWFRDQLGPETLASAGRIEPASRQWRPTWGWALLMGGLLFLCLKNMLSYPPSEFLYFQF